MDKHSKELRQYFKEIKKQTNIYNGSPRFFDELKDNIYTYISINPEASIHNIYEKYGEPSEVEKAFFQQVDMETYKRKTMVAKYIKQLILLGFISFAVLAAALFIDRQINRPTTVEYVIETHPQGE